MALLSSMGNSFRVVNKKLNEGYFVDRTLSSLPNWPFAPVIRIVGSLTAEDDINNFQLLNTKL